MTRGAAELRDERERLPQAIVALMRDIGMPSGIAAVGFAADDIPDLVEGTLKQQRILAMAPRDVMPEDLRPRSSATRSTTGDHRAAMRR